MCGATSEGEQENAFGPRASRDEPRDSIDKRSCFPRAGPGDDEERTIAVICSGLDMSAPECST